MYPGNMTASGYVKLDARDKDGDLTKSKYYWDAIVDAFLDDATMPEKDENGKTNPQRVRGVTDPATRVTITGSSTRLSSL